MSPYISIQKIVYNFFYFNTILTKFDNSSVKRIKLFEKCVEIKMKKVEFNGGIYEILFLSWKK